MSIPRRFIAQRLPSARTKCVCGAPAIMVVNPTLIVWRCERTGELIDFARVADDLYDELADA